MRLPWADDGGNGSCAGKDSADEIPHLDPAKKSKEFVLF
jgi:hypothetical protein